MSKSLKGGGVNVMAFSIVGMRDKKLSKTSAKDGSFVELLSIDKAKPTVKICNFFI